MPSNYNFTENGVVYNFDDVFVPEQFFSLSSLFTWGYNIYGALGTNNAGINSRSTPVTTFSGGTNWKSISCGDQHTAAIKTDGTLWVWGNDGNGQLGLNEVAGRIASTPVTTFAGGNNWKQVSCTSASTMAIKTDGTLWGWGSQGVGILGNNNPFVGNVLTPVTTFAGGNDWKQVSIGSNHTAAIKTDGTLWTWGGNGASGCLGINSPVTSRSTPVTTFAGGNDWKYVSCRSDHTAAIKNDGTLWVWGSDNLGLLGANQAISYARSTPVTTFAGGNNWKSISDDSGSTYHILAIKTDGTLWTWGRNLEGQLGINSAFGGQTNAITPVTTFAGGTNWKSVSCGFLHTLATKTDGTLWMWGDNSNGQLGVNSITNILTPVTTILGGSSWIISTGGAYYSAAIRYQ